MKSKNIVFFDICGTLYKENTTFAFIDWLSKRNNNRQSAMKAFSLRLLSALLYKVSGLDLLKSQKVAQLKSMNVDEVGALCDEFVTQHLTKQEEVLTLYRNYKSNGYRIILVSATIEPLAKAIAKDLNSDEYYSTTLSKEYGKYTGGIEKEIYTEKHGIVKRLLDENSYLNSVFVTDNFPDLKSCQLCKQSLAIAKNKSARKFWLRNGIKVLDIL